MTSTLDLIKAEAKIILDTRSEFFHEPACFTCNQLQEQLYVKHAVSYTDSKEVIYQLGKQFTQDVLNPSLVSQGCETIKVGATNFIGKYVKSVASESDNQSKIHVDMRTRWLNYLINYGATDTKDAEHTILFRGKWFSSFAALWRYCHK